MSARDALLAAVAAWDRAMITNDADFVHDDDDGWRCVHTHLSLLEGSHRND